MRRSLFVLAGLFSAGCALAAGYGAMPAKPQIGNWGVDLNAIDTSVKPGDDFFAFVNGKWRKTIQIPADRTSIGTFQQLLILSEKRLRDIVAELDVRPADRLAPEERKLRDLYDAFEDRQQIESKGIGPAKSDLDLIAKLGTLDGIARAMASPRLSTLGVFNISIAADQKNPNAYSVVLTQSGIGMPDRDYFLRDDPALATTRDAYKKYSLRC